MRMIKTRLGAVALGGLVAGGGAALLLRRRMSTDGAGPVRHAATVLLPPDEVRAAWTEGGRLPELLTRVAPAEGNRAPAQQVPGVEGLRLRIELSPAPGGRGTEIRLAAEGPAARVLSGRLRSDMRQLKSVLECGEAVTVEGQPSARSERERRVTREIGRLLRMGGRG